MKKLLIPLGILIGLLVLAGVAILRFVDVNAYKPRIESAVSDTLGMEIDRILSKAIDAQKLGLADVGAFVLAGPLGSAALKGKLDIVNGRFLDVTVAALDGKGCAKLRQNISGPFGAPRMDKISVLQSFAEPILGAFGRAGKLLGISSCEPFYEGAVRHP